MNSFQNIISANPKRLKFSGNTYSRMEETLESAKKMLPTEIDPAVNKLIKLLEEIPSENTCKLLNLHIEIMMFYYEHRNSDPSYLSKSSYHAKEALLKGDSSGVAAYRLIANLIKEKRIEQAIEVCSIVGDPAYEFSSSAIIKKPAFTYKMKKLKHKIKSGKNLNYSLFNEDEVKIILNKFHNNNQPSMT